MGGTRRRLLGAATLLLVGGLAVVGWTGHSGSSASAAVALPPIHHVFVIVLENEEDTATFSNPPPAPYLATTMRSEGAYLPNYYAIGHSSLDNYVAMISGQAPNTDTQNDCADFVDFPVGDGTDGDGQQTGLGCVYPAAINTIAGQLTSAGLTWGAYDESMGSDPARESATCGHPTVGDADNTEGGETAAPFDEYATRHNPFMYFHSIIDDQASCNQHVVNLNQLPAALASAATTPNYVFITPDLCGDGHDNPCKDPSRPGGFAGINDFLSTWVPRITASPAYADGGLIITTFDEGEGDSSSCCGEVAGPGSPTPGSSADTPGATGGGDTGAVLLSPYIAPGTVSNTPYNHYAMLASVEDIFGLTRLGFANGTTAFGSDVFTRPNGPPTTTTKTSTSSSVTTMTTTTSTTSSRHVIAPPPTCAVPKLAKAKHGKLPVGALLRAAKVASGQHKQFIEFTAVRRESVTVAVKPRRRKVRRLASLTVVACRVYRFTLPAGHGVLTVRASVRSGAATVTKHY